MHFPFFFCFLHFLSDHLLLQVAVDVVVVVPLVVAVDVLVVVVVLW